MPRLTTRAHARRNVLHQLSPDEMPMAPSGPEDPNMPSRGDALMPASSHTYKNAALVSAPVLDHATGAITMGRKMQTYMDPEHHIATTSRAPGANEMTGVVKLGGIQISQRAAAQDEGRPVPAYGGSTDARTGAGEPHRSTSAVWDKKKRESAQPKDATERKMGVDERTGSPAMQDVPVHGRGLLDAVRSGESIRNPAHLIIDPSPPKYGPRIDTAGDFDVDDSGGFGHGEPVQWQGHHRVAAAAMHQQALRESGAKNWQVPVPYDLHMGTDAALAHHPMMAASENIMDQNYSRRKKLAQMFASRGGTWNSKAY